MVRSDWLKKRFNFELMKIKRTASVASLFLLVLANSIILAEYMEGWGVSPRYSIPVTVLLLGLLVMLGSHIYVIVLEMYKAEASAERMLSPYTVWAIAPFEEMMYRFMWIPQFEAIYSGMTDKKAKQEFRERLDKFIEWVELGYIPKKDFPFHLKKYYITKDGERL